MKFVSAVLVCMLTLLAGGCANFVSHTAVAYNDGLSDSFNTLILSNVIRASQGLPTYYSALGEYSASQSHGVGFDPSLSINFDGVSGANVNAAMNADSQNEENASASSLETHDFAAAMHAGITASIFETLTESRDRDHMHLTLVLLVELVVISEGDFRYVMNSIDSNCGGRSDLLSAVYQGICRFLSSADRSLTCFDLTTTAGTGGKTGALITLLNDPTNPCRYRLFRIFAEALTLNDLHAREENNATVIRLGHVAPGKPIFREPGTGIQVRSPHEVISYLGQVVRLRNTNDGGHLALSDQNGNSVPVFAVNQGAPDDAPITARLNRFDYSVPGWQDSDSYFTLRSIALVKDIIALNTGQSQLPKNPTILLGGASRN